MPVVASAQGFFVFRGHHAGLIFAPDEPMVRASGQETLPFFE